MKKLLYLLIFIISMPLFSNENNIQKIKEYYTNIEKEIIQNKENPELYKIDQFEKDKIFEIEDYKSTNLIDLANSTREIMGIYMVYANYLPIYEEEFTEIHLFVLEYLELIVDLSIYNDKGINVDKTMIIQGFYKAIEGSCFLFSATGEFDDKNRLKMALMTKEVLLRKLELIPITGKTTISSHFSTMISKETNDEIKNIEKEIIKILNLEGELVENLKQNKTDLVLDYYISDFIKLIESGDYKMRISKNPSSMKIGKEIKYYDKKISPKNDVFVPTVITIQSNYGSYIIYFYRDSKDEESLETENIIITTFQFYNRSQKSYVMPGGRLEAIFYNIFNEDDIININTEEYNTIDFSYTKNKNEKQNITPGLSVTRNNNEKIIVLNKEEYINKIEKKIFELLASE